MAFIKKCESTVSRCNLCGKTGVYQVEGKLYCEECSKLKKKPEKPKSKEK